MRKGAWIMPAAAVVAGIAGCFLRKKELATVFDPVTGLAERGAPVTLMLIGLTVLVAVASVVYGLVAFKGRQVEPRYHKAFAPGGPAGLLVCVLACLALLIGGALYYVNARAQYSAGIIAIVFTVFAIASAATQLSLAINAFKGRQTSGMGTASVIAPLFICFWLVVAYKEHATNPVLLYYYGQCIALAAAALSFYFAAGFAFKRSQLRPMVILSVFASYMCLMCLPDFGSLSLKLIACGLTALMVMNTVSVTAAAKE